MLKCQYWHLIDIYLIYIINTMMGTNLARFKMFFSLIFSTTDFSMESIIYFVEDYASALSNNAIDSIVERLIIANSEGIT